jgi:eukaryotic-like serine/threonine-protein kinase
MALGRRVWTAGKLFVLGSALLATYLLFAVGAMRVAFKAREVAVPSLRGLSVNEASSLLANAGLTLRVDESRRFDAEIPLDRVALQDPAESSTARRGRSVKVWISAGARANTIPPLIGETLTTAEARLQQDGIALEGVSEIRSSEHPIDTVVAQSPPPHARGNAVSLLVNRGESGGGYVMPDIIGLMGNRAAEVLRAQGFRVAVVAEHPYPGVPPGVVLRQHPEAGFQIAPGEPVSLEVSR